MRTSLLALAGLVALTGCDNTDDDATPTTFSVTIENVSTPGTVDTDRAMGAVPLSPPTWAVFDGDDPMFRSGERANAGTERITEDGFPDEMLAILGGASNVSAFAAQTSPGGADNGPAVFPALGGAPAESVTFTFQAEPGDQFQFETMFVQSNDWFYAFPSGGIDLFENGTPVSGDLTSRLRVYDAGTEQDTAPGTGPDQKPVQEPMARNVGPEEDEDIALASVRHPSFSIPANGEVIRVTITPAAQ